MVALIVRVDVFFEDFVLSMEEMSNHLMHFQN